MRVDTLAIRRLFERVASWLRRAGLGRMVEVVRPLLARRLDTFVTTVDGLVLTGRNTEQIDYARDVRGGREGHLIELMKERLGPGDVVVDGGAYLGYTTLQAARCVGSSGRVYAFEPNPALAATLRENVTRNGFEDRVTVLDRALSHTSGPAPFFVRGAADMSSLHPGRGGAAVAVQAVRGDDILGDGARLDLVKLDVEGGELDALRGLSRSIAGAGPDLTLLVEYNPVALLEAGSSGEELLAWLEAAGFEIHAVDEERRSLAPLEDFPGSGWVNLHCRRRAGGSAVPLPK